jgi:hypothetical protein
MKKRTLFPVSYFLVSILCFSCNKENVTPNEQTVYDKLTSFTLSEQKNAYQTLKESEKAGLWVIHINQMLKENNYTSEQLNIIEEAKKFLSKGLIDNENFKNSSQYIIWNHKVSEVFSKEKMFALFVSLSQTSNLPNTTTNLKAPESGCDCSTASDWCNFPVSGTPGTYWACDDGSACTVSNNGCGTLWSYSCNNSCKLHTIVAN